MNITEVCWVFLRFACLHTGYSPVFSIAITFFFFCQTLVFVSPEELCLGVSIVKLANPLNRKVLWITRNSILYCSFLFDKLKISLGTWIGSVWTLIFPTVFQSWAILLLILRFLWVKHWPQWTQWEHYHLFQQGQHFLSSLLEASVGCAQVSQQTVINCTSLFL